MKKITKSNLLKVAKENWGSSLKRLAFLSLGIILSLSSLSAADYCHFEVQSTRATGKQTAYITCQSLGGNVYEFKFETVNDIVDWNKTGSNFYAEVNGIGGTQVSNNLIKSLDNKTLTWTVTSSPKPNIYVCAFFVNFSDGEHQFNLPTDENFAAVCSVAGIPTLAATTAATDITTTTATSGGNVTVEGNSAVTARGVCWGTAAAPTVALATKTVDGAGAGSFTSSITGLSSGIKYYVRSYATNTEGTAYGAEVNFTTLDTEIPAAFTATKGAVGATTVELLLNATDNSGSITYTVSYGAGPTVVSTIGTSGVQKSYIVTGLTEATAYTFSIVAKDAALNAATNNPLEITATTTATVPAIAASTPPVRIATDVVSIFSDAYTPAAGTRNYNPGWGQSGSASIIQVATDNTLKYSNLNYQGTVLGSNVDASGMTYLHIDVWSANETSLQFYLISTTAPSEKFVQLTPLVQNSWNSYDIPLTSYTSQAGFSVASLKELKVVGSGGKTVCFDNIYFYRDAVVGDVTAPTLFNAAKGAVTRNSVELLLNATDESGSITYTVTYGATTVNVAGTSAVQKSYVVSGLTSETAYSFSVVAKDAAGNSSTNSPLVIDATTLVGLPAAPTPTVDAVNVMSVYSGTYTNLPTSLQNWSGNTFSNELFGGNEVLTNTSNCCFGYEFAAKPVNVSAMNKLHVDIYSETLPSMTIGLVTTAENKKTGIALTSGQWNSIDVLLSELTGANLATVNQIGFWNLNGKFYLDNLYFYNDAATGVSKLTAENRINCYPNPVNNQLTVNAKTQISQVIVNDLLGQNVKSIMVNSLEKTIDLSDVNSGNYIVTVKLANGQLSTQKIVKL